MLRQFINWRTLLSLIAIAIVSATVFYSNYLAQKIEREERKKVEAWVEAGHFLMRAPADEDIKLPLLIRNEQTSIPIIETDEKDSIINYINIDSNRIFNNPEYLKNKLAEFKRSNGVIEYVAGANRENKNRYYYGNSLLLQEIRYYPLIQLFIVALFIVITLLSLHVSNRSTQNQVWAGMAKETAHQLGTPVSSLQGWLEVLKDSGVGEDIVREMEKDVERLKLVSDRFGKIGSKPQLVEVDVMEALEHMVEYMRRRAPEKIKFEFERSTIPSLYLRLSPQLFEWVIENLLRNALDSMEGSGRIRIWVRLESKRAVIDLADTGKGIPRASWERIFRPGYSTKKRGWGLGLSLSRRIIEQYHQGELYVRSSEPGKGTTFRIILPRLKDAV
jgi:signal transduction histidine kinase